MTNDITPYVDFSALTSVTDNKISNWYHTTWADLVNIITTQGHLETESKDVSLISPWKYKTLDDDYAPRLTSDGRLWLIDDKPVVGRLADNVIGTSMLMFDFDGDLSLGDAKLMFAKWTHLGYTSYSHMSPSKNCADCFRVIVPLAQFVTAEQLVDRRPAIYAAFAGVDKSCLSLARSFYIASASRARMRFAHMWTNDGELFDVMEYQPNVYVPPLHSPVIHSTADNETILEALKHVYLGNEPDWFKVACAMVSNGFTYDEFCDVSIGHLMTSKSIADCARKWKSAERRVERGFTSSIGCLVNVCKQHGVWKTPKQIEREKAEKRLAYIKGATV